MTTHRHKWFEESVTMNIGLTREMPITGVTVVWRCRGDAGTCLPVDSYSLVYNFRRPTWNATYPPPSGPC
jgi:hypothetical protein